MSSRKPINYGENNVLPPITLHRYSTQPTVQGSSRRQRRRNRHFPPLGIEQSVDGHICSRQPLKWHDDGPNYQLVAAGRWRGLSVRKGLTGEKSRFASFPYISRLCQRITFTEIWSSSLLHLQETCTLHNNAGRCDIQPGMITAILCFLSFFLFNKPGKIQSSLASKMSRVGYRSYSLKMNGATTCSLISDCLQGLKLWAGGKCQSDAVTQDT